MTRIVMSFSLHTEDDKELIDYLKSMRRNRRSDEIREAIHDRMVQSRTPKTRSGSTPAAVVNVQQAYELAGLAPAAPKPSPVVVTEPTTQPAKMGKTEPAKPTGRFPLPPSISSITKSSKSTTDSED